MLDKCSICDPNPFNDCATDCAGIWGGGSELDNCKVCGGNGSSCWVEPDPDKVSPNAAFVLEVNTSESMSTIVAAMARQMGGTPAAMSVSAHSQIELAADISDVPSQLAERQEFELNVSSSLAVVLGVPMDTVQLKTIVGGSVVVAFAVDLGVNSTGASHVASTMPDFGRLQGTSVADFTVIEVTNTTAATFLVQAAALIESGTNVATALEILSQRVKLGVVTGVTAGQSLFETLDMPCPSGFYKDENTMPHCERT